jgi:prolyl-tRNA synthetase
VRELTEKIYQDLIDHGVLFTDMDLIGIPHQIVIREMV